MIYGSVCSGIEAASVAWHPLGWRPAFFSEIDKFPRRVLAHHYPDVPLHGDFTTINEGDYASISVLVGGTPCQSFSVAGLRAGLADPRGNLMLGFGALAERLRPRWLVWENVPGVLSSNGGRDFGSFLGMLAELGYGFAYRILDAQFFGVAQRRRRVFVVGCLGDWRRAAAVLFERDSLSGNPAPSREAGKSIANALTDRADRGGTNSEGQRLIPFMDVAPTLNAHFGTKHGPEDQHVRGGGACLLPRVAMCLNAGAMGRRDSETETLIPTTGAGFDVAHSLRGEGFDASEDGTGRGTPIVPVAHAFDARQSSVIQYGDKTGPLDTDGHSVAVAFSQNQRDEVRVMVAGALAAEPGAKQQTYLAVDCYNGALTGDVACTMGTMGSPINSAGPQLIAAMQVRRLTPRECERLQGFPDDYTDIQPNGKPTPDGPRYKALGNSMAVPVMRWIGSRIQQVEAIA